MTAAPRWHRFASRDGEHVLVLAGSQIVDLPRGADVDADDLRAFLDHGDTLGLDEVPDTAAQGISLNVTSACNLGCAYCYADRGRFDGRQRGTMTHRVARDAVDALLAGCHRGAPATVGFLGGEPFLHPQLIHDVVAYASAAAAALGQPLGFSATTNATRLRPADHALIRSSRFALTVSIDGDPATHDLLRRNLLGGATFGTVIDGVGPLLADPGQATVSARATLVSGRLNLTERYDALTAHGFTHIGFAPVRTGYGAFTADDWAAWTAASIDLGERELSALLQGGASGFDNLLTALRRLHAGSASPYPCGAGGGYASVATDGRWYACHRAIGRPDYALDGDGDGAGGVTVVDPDRQRAFLAERHVDRIPGCSTCWARYLCSGGCHQEAPARTDASCDAIRDWLHFCLDAYCTLSTARPDWFIGDRDARR